MKKIAIFLLLATGLVGCQSTGVTAPSAAGRERLTTAGFVLGPNGGYFCPKTRCGADTYIASFSAPLGGSDSSLTGEQLVKSGILNASGLKKLLQALEDAKPVDKLQFSNVTVVPNNASILVDGTTTKNGVLYYFKGIVKIQGNSSISRVSVSSSIAHASRYYAFLPSY